MKTQIRIRDIFSGVLDLLYPPKCIVCGTLGLEPACAECLRGFRPIPGPICRHCGSVLESGKCKRCRFIPAEYISGARSACVFEGTLRRAIHRLKYEGKRSLAGPLGIYLGEFLSRRPFGRIKHDMIVPIPLHRTKLREREFNQAALIANEVGRILSLPVVEECVIRVRNTSPQVGLDASERVRNVKGAFRVVDPGALKGRNVLLVDDVATTLSTADACAEPILDAGAQAVVVSTLGRDL